MEKTTERDGSFLTTIEELLREMGISAVDFQKQIYRHPMLLDALRHLLTEMLKKARAFASPPPALKFERVDLSQLSRQRKQSGVRDDHNFLSFLRALIKGGFWIEKDESAGGVLDPVELLLTAYKLELEAASSFFDPTTSNGDITRLHASQLIALLNERGQRTLRWLYEAGGVTHLPFLGLQLSSRDEDSQTRGIFSLERSKEGHWGIVFSRHTIENQPEDPFEDTFEPTVGSLN